MKKEKLSKKKKIFLGVTTGLTMLVSLIYITSDSKKNTIKNVSFKEDNLNKKKFYNKKKKYNGFKPHKNNFKFKKK